MPSRKLPLTHMVWIAALVAPPVILSAFTLPSTAASPQAAVGASQQVRVPGGEQTVTLRLRDMALADALRLIAQRAQLSFSIGPDVTGQVDFDFYNEPLNKVLEIILASNNLQMRQVGNTYLISKSPSAGLGGVKTYQLNYAAAAQMVTLLTGSLKAAGIEKAEEFLIADPRSNTIIASGNPYFQEQVGRLIQRLDQPQSHQIFNLNYINAEEAAKLLSESVFAGTKDAGVKFIPIVRENALMVVGSGEDLKLAAEVIDKIDRRLRQVLIEAKLIELNGTSQNLLSVTFDAQTGQVTSGFEPTQGLNVGYDPMAQALSQVRARINALLRDNKARLLASPSIVAMDSKESKIQITDDIIEKTITETTVNATATVVRTNVTLGNAGITLAITPKINPDGYISMKVEPAISFIRETVRDPQNNIIATLKSERKLTTPEVRVRDGETLIIGGLNQDRTQEVVEKVPLLGDIPLLGTLFRRTDTRKETTELVVMLTPKVVPEGERPGRPARK
ncbi:MAG: secretin N-terminal domain-containing protein [Candidatus Sericytochromatia bacterium]